MRVLEELDRALVTWLQPYRLDYILFAGGLGITFYMLAIKVQYYPLSLIPYIALLISGVAYFWPWLGPYAFLLALFPIALAISPALGFGTIVAAVTLYYQHLKKPDSVGQAFRFNDRGIPNFFLLLAVSPWLASHGWETLIPILSGVLYPKLKGSFLAFGGGLFLAGAAVVFGSHYFYLPPPSPMPSLVLPPADEVRFWGLANFSWDSLFDFYYQTLLGLFSRQDWLLLASIWGISAYGVGYLGSLKVGRQRLVQTGVGVLLVLLLQHQLLALPFPKPSSLLGAMALAYVLSLLWSGEAGSGTEGALAPVPVANNKLGLTRVRTGETNGTPVGWDDIVGYDDVKQEIRDAISLHFNPLASQEFVGARPIRGILLFGPAGVGKTLFARAIATESKAAFIGVSGPEFFDKWFGESESRLRKLFLEARRQPTVLFFDEIEAFLPQRGRDMYDHYHVLESIVSTFLGQMDGLGSFGEQVLVVGATNHPEHLDSAALRPGRFDKVIYIPPPDRLTREKLFSKFLANKRVGADVDVSRLAALTERYTGADVEGICNSAALEARNHPISMGYLEALISQTKPSVSLAMLKHYEAMREKFQRRSRITAQKRSEDQPDYTWEDVSGLDEAKRVIEKTILLPLAHPEILQTYRVRPPRGVLFFGPPGCGKTLLAKVIASKVGAKFYPVQGPELLRGVFGESERAIRDLFTRAKENAPAIIFFDEVDALGNARDHGAGSALVNQLLAEMDGMEELNQVIVLAATNRLESLDRALLRPGRFDRLVFVGPPNEQARADLFRKKLSGIPGSDQLDFSQLAAETEGYSGADIEYICSAVALSKAEEAVEKKQVVAITTEDMLKQISITPSSLREIDLEAYWELAQAQRL
ncbi:MAG: AAA family ATPase [Clostridia bacterium]|nr:AAA family ATPase [Clostridia bacterium]